MWRANDCVKCTRNFIRDPSRRFANRLQWPMIATFNSKWEFCAILSTLLTALSVVALPAADKTHPASMQLTSTAFREGEPIPAKHTCDANNVSPPLQWNGAPPGTKSLALIVDDPDAPMGIWVHWVLFDLP